jgi:hypothetical protein
VALLLCEQLIVDDQTQNVTPVNCFSRRILDGPLDEPQTFAIFCLLTDGLGTMPAELEITRLDTDEVIYRKRFELRFDNPLQQLRCLLRVRRCVFPVAGAYQTSLLVEGESIALRRFLVVHEEKSS